MKAVSFFFRLLIAVLLLMGPIAAYIQVKNRAMVEGQRVKRIERRVLVLKKTISNLERELTDRTDYARIERMGRLQHHLKFIYENNNPVLVIREGQ